MRTNTEKYEFTHGRKPRGHGLWALSLTGTDGQGRYTKQEYRVSGNLTEAKKQACRRFKNEVGGVKSIVEVMVLP